MEDRLTTHITRFLLELGQGFSFVGRQVHLEMGGQDYYIEMLFYHLRLCCYVVIGNGSTLFSCRNEQTYRCGIVGDRSRARGC